MHTTPISIEFPNRVNITIQKRRKANGINRVVEENNAETENSLRLSQKETRGSESRKPKRPCNREKQQINEMRSLGRSSPKKTDRVKVGGSRKNNRVTALQFESFLSNFVNLLIFFVFLSEEKL
jgi:hypothetical protein